MIHDQLCLKMNRCMDRALNAPALFLNIITIGPINKMIENKKNSKQIPDLYKQYKEHSERKNFQLDMMKFLEVHKRGIDFYNSYGLGLKKKQSKQHNQEQGPNPHENQTPFVKEQQSKTFYNKYFKGTKEDEEERSASEELARKRQNENLNNENAGEYRSISSHNHYRKKLADS